MRWVVLIWVGAVALGCGGDHPPSVVQSDPPHAAAVPAAALVQIEMKNVRLRMGAGVVLDVRTLRGEMVPAAARAAPVFDEPRSYTLRVFSGDVSMDTGSLAALMNGHLFTGEDAPLKDIEVEIDEGRLEQRAKLKKGIWLPFSMKASVSTTPDGRLRLRTESVKALGIPATKLLDLFGLEVEDLVEMKNRRGVEIRDDDVIISPGQVLPPPEIRGHLARVELSPAGLRQIFAAPDRPAAAPLSPPDPAAPNYIYFSGASIRFGKLTMTGSDLQLIDADASDPFDFYPAKYDQQLIAGYSKNTPAKGLKTYMPDFDDLAAGTDLRPVRDRRN
jgi:hypothetical protein